MKTFSSNEIRNELSHGTQKQLLDICLRLVRFKKENKELVSFLLFEANDISYYVGEIKKEIDEGFDGMNRSQLYFAKKTIRKILKDVNRYIRYISSKESEAGLLIYFCKKIKESGLPIHKSTALTNLYNNQVKKIRKAIESLHEDLQYDLSREVDTL